VVSLCVAGLRVSIRYDKSVVRDKQVATLTKSRQFGNTCKRCSGLSESWCPPQRKLFSFEFEYLTTVNVNSTGTRD
jgi:hypothetical protein